MPATLSKRACWRWNSTPTFELTPIASIRFLGRRFERGSPLLNLYKNQPSKTGLASTRPITAQQFEDGNRARSNPEAAQDEVREDVFTG